MVCCKYVFCNGMNWEIRYGNKQDYSPVENSSHPTLGIIYGISDKVQNYDIDPLNQATFSLSVANPENC